MVMSFHLQMILLPLAHRLFGPVAHAQDCRKILRGGQGSQTDGQDQTHHQSYKNNSF